MGEYICDECGGDLLPDACGCIEKKYRQVLEDIMTQAQSAIVCDNEECGIMASIIEKVQASLASS
jgi:hypothetical protein